MKIVSWNINGIRAAVGKAFLEELSRSEADIYCLQETKAQDEQVKTALKDVTDYHIYSHSAEKKGYSGVAILTKKEPIWWRRGIDIAEHDTEGRVLTLAFEQCIVVNVYVPNSGEALARLGYRSEWDAAFGDYLVSLTGEKPVIVTGDFNVSHQPIDLARPKDNYNKTSGYTQVEIDGMTSILGKGFVDTFRSLHPDKVKYSFWSQRFGARARNVGWRLDYILVDQVHHSTVLEADIHDDIMGSDHCPVSIVTNFD